jgi:hypothetical protein
MSIFVFALIPFLLMIFFYRGVSWLMGRWSTFEGHAFVVTAWLVTAALLVLIPFLFYSFAFMSLPIQGAEGDSTGLLIVFVAIGFWGAAGISLVLGLPFSILRRRLRR